MDIAKLTHDILKIKDDLQKSADTYFYEPDYTQIIDNILNAKVKAIIPKLKQLKLDQVVSTIKESFSPINGNAIEFVEYFDCIHKEILDCSKWSSPKLNAELVKKIALQMQSLYAIYEINHILKSIGVENLSDEPPASKRVYVQEKLCDASTQDIILLAKDLGVIENTISIDRCSQAIGSEYLDEQASKCNKKLADGDYDGAITNARTFLEEILLAIEEKITGTRGSYSGNLPQLYKKIANKLNMRNDEYSGPLRKLLDGMEQSIAAVGGISDKVGDRHAATTTYKPSERHARLVINACFTLGDYLVSSYQAQYE